MKRTWRFWIITLVCSAAATCFFIVAQPAFAATTSPSTTMMNQILPTENQIGMSVQTTPTYRIYPPDRYAFDLGYSLVTWEWGGLKPSLNDPIPYLGDAIASWLFIGAGFITRFSIFLSELGFHTKLVNDQLAAITPLLIGLRHSLFGRVLPFSLIALAAWPV